MSARLTRFSGDLYRVITAVLAVGFLAFGGERDLLAQSFAVVADLGDPEGREPHGGLVEGRDGNLYGTTVSGGNAKGTIFRIVPGGSPETLHLFSGASDGAYPEAGLTLGADGSFYGVTRYGGASNKGTVFKFDPVAERLAILHVFTGADGAEPRGELVQAANGQFYGTTSSGGANYGNVFRISSSGSFAVLRQFTGGSDGRRPFAGLIEGPGGYLYGTTSSGGASSAGTVFRISTAGALTTLVAFSGGNGANPVAGLLLARDGNYYGTTFGGGSAYQGVVFRLTPSGTLTVIASFNGSNGSSPAAELIQAADGHLYGTTSLGGASGRGTLFRVTLSGTLTNLRSLAASDGARPDGPLMQSSNGHIYGTAPAEGPIGAAGTLFEITTSGSFSRLYAFRGSPTSPYGDLKRGPDGRLFGTSNTGGASGYGSIFAFDPDTGDIELLHTFSLSDGANPNDGVTLGNDGNLYGTTLKGGSANLGAVFKKAPNGAFTPLGSLSNSTSAGYWPYAGLTQTADGTLYGVAYAGGSGSSGTIFKVLSGGSLTMLAAFNGGNGAGPYGRMVEGPDGLLYGTTAGGGPSRLGNIFRFDPVSRTLTSLFAFSGANGSNPYASLIVGSDGRLYGTTYGGGAGSGTVFAFDTDTRQLTTIHVFTGGGGAHPYARLLEAKDGRLYGTTSMGGAANFGTVFSVGKSGGHTLLHSFTGKDGKYPRSGLSQVADGSLFGTASQGGSANNGVIYRVGGASVPPPPGDASIAVTSPNTAVNWGVGSTHKISWKHTVGTGTSSRVELSRDGGATWEVIAGAVANGATTGSMTWTVTGPATTHARLKITSAGVSDKSDQDFAIAAPYVRVTAPNVSADVWTSGTKATIKWAHNLGSAEKVKIELSRDGTTYSKVLFAETPSDGAAAVTVDRTWVSAKAKIRITWVKNGAVRDQSDSVFVIK
jgi:uncharacterized repeat protein (TIGR03803 family)